MQKLKALTRFQVLDALEAYGVLLLVTSKSGAPLLEDDPRLTPKEMSGAVLPAVIRLFNLTGVPSVPVDCGFNAEGLLTCLQIVGRPFA